MRNDIEKRILEIITTKRTYKEPFDKIISGFNDKFSNLNLTTNNIEIVDYFNEGSGLVTARKNLLANDKIQKDWLREYKTEKGKLKIDFKGLYVFLHDNTPFYVGISKGVIGRILQHVKGHNHNSSTLAYNIGLIRYELLNGKKHDGSRDELNFKTEVEPVKKFLSKQKVVWLHIDNDEELYLFEVYCAMRLKTILNKFETH